MTTKKFFVAALVCCLGLGFSSKASANSWRVNIDKRANADFKDLNAAMEKVSEGDTIYMDKGCTLSSVQRITTPVTIIGPGYFIGENDADEAYLSNSLYLEADGIKITGLHTSAIYVRANDIVVERCRITGDVYAHETDYESDNFLLCSSFLYNSSLWAGNKEVDGMQILNNIFYRSTNVYFLNDLRNALVDHNTMVMIDDSYGYLIGKAYNSTISNNILFRRGYSNWNYYMAYVGAEYDNIITNNVGNGTWGTDIYPNNVSESDAELKNFFVCSGEDMSRDVFFDQTRTESMTISVDESSQEILIVNADVTTSSVASETVTTNHFAPKKAKYYNADYGYGHFGGAYPYVMHGYPLYVPRFESIVVPSQPDANGNLKVRMVIKNQNK